MSLIKLASVVLKSLTTRSSCVNSLPEKGKFTLGLDPGDKYEEGKIHAWQNIDKNKIREFGVKAQEKELGGNFPGHEFIGRYIDRTNKNAKKTINTYPYHFKFNNKKSLINFRKALKSFGDF